MRRLYGVTLRTSGCSALSVVQADPTRGSSAAVRKIIDVRDAENAFEALAHLIVPRLCPINPLPSRFARQRGELPGSDVALLT